MSFVYFTQRGYFSLLFILVLALFVTFIYRAEYFDEAWFAEQSFWLIRDGQVRSELFRGYNGWENGLYVFHKLFIYAGALVMAITGFSVGASKVVSIFFGLVGAFLVWRYNQRTSREQQYLALLLYIGCGSLIRHVSINRPETMCMALGFASYMALDPPGSSRPKALLGGLLAGLAALTHLNGLIYLVAGSLWLLIRADWRSVGWFVVVGSLTLSLYAVDALLDGHMAILVAQFCGDPATQQNFHVGDKLSVMADFHHIFFHSEKEAALTALVLLAGIVARRHIRLSQPVFLYSLLLIGSFWVLTKSATDIYFLLFLPWLSILAASWLLQCVAEQPRWQRKAARMVLIIYGLIAGVQLVNVFNENRTTPDIESHNALLARQMPKKGAHVIAPLEFFFGQMDNYRIQGLTYYHLLEREKGAIPLDTFFTQANEADIEYILSDHRLNASYDIPVDAPARIGEYHRVFQDKWNTIYARNQDNGALSRNSVVRKQVKSAKTESDEAISL
ncbi:hypothetical protein [Spirosoma aerophilum]